MKTFPCLPSQFDSLRSRLMQLGVTLPSGTDGVIAHSGIELKYHYDGATLTISILKKPFILSSSLVWSKVEEWIAA